MRIKMLKTSADPGGTKVVGREYTVSNEEGKALIQAEAAVSLEKKTRTRKKVE